MIKIQFGALDSVLGPSPVFPCSRASLKLLYYVERRRKNPKSVMVINEKSEFKRLILFFLNYQISENKSLFDSYFKEYLN